MKELSIEEKAKRYDEAIKRANELNYVSDKDSLQRKTVEHIFPEFKESEDDRIRKAIKYGLDHVFTNNTTVFGVTKEQCLTWLEKQCTPAKLSEEEQNKFAKGVLTSCALSFINYLDAHKYKGKMCVSNGECEDIENAFHNAMWDRLHRYYCKYIEKQGEQKSAWSEEDDKILKSIIINIENLQFSEDMREKYHHILNANKSYYQIKIDWLESLKDRVQPKQEWSEENEEIIEKCIGAIRHSCYSHSTKIKVVKFLESLRPQKQWKPSEEQMKALDEARSLANNCGEESAFDLRTLHEQLKKLREE